MKTMTIDEWCVLQVDGEKRVRGRLLQTSPTELVLVAGVADVRRFQVTSANGPSRHAVLDDGRSVRWTRTCGCGQPASLKGPAARLLEAVGA